MLPGKNFVLALPLSEVAVVHLVSAVIHPQRVDQVTAALRDIGITGLTVTPAHGSSGVGHMETYRGTEHVVPFVPMVKLEVLCDTFDAELVAKVIVVAAHSGGHGDGKVWISTVERFISIRTNDVDVDAL